MWRPYSYPLDTESISILISFFLIQLFFIISSFLLLRSACFMLCLISPPLASCYEVVVFWWRPHGSRLPRA